MKPDANSRKANQSKKSGSEFFVPGCYDSFFFDALEEVFDTVAFFVETFVECCRKFSISLGRDAGLQAQPVQGPAELIGVVSFVGEDGSLRTTLHQIRSGGQIVALSGGQTQTNRSSLVVDQGMNLGVGATSGASNLLETSNFHGTEPVLVDFDAGRIDGPQLSFRLFSKLFKNLVPDSCFAPLFSTSVNSGGRSEDAQSSPGTTFTQPEKQGFQNEVNGCGWSTSFFNPQYRFGIGRNLINFFSSSSLEVSLG
jgi:hypothetical protein